MGIFNKKQEEKKEPTFQAATQESLSNTNTSAVADIAAFARKEFIKAVEKKPVLMDDGAFTDSGAMLTSGEATTGPTPPAVKKKQFELSGGDISFLGQNQYSDSAWEAVGRKHGIDHTTREVIPNSDNRAFLAAPKNWAPLPPPPAQIVTTQSIHSSEYHQLAPVPASPEAIREEMRKRSLTKPTSDETKVEEI